ncbi:MAG: TonB C-terminal domain-containing protein [Betaproteobacteria bacterium]|nr:TonB C-terminal domain-containing protein [Betaproteobacteria bacterium]
MNTAEALHFVTPSAPGKLVSMVLAVGVHLLLLAFLFYGIRWQTKPEAIEVELVQAAPVTAEPVMPQEAPPPRAEPVVEPEPAPSPPKPEIALKEKEKPKPVVKEKPKPTPQEAPKTPLPFLKQLEQEFRQVTERKEAAAVAQELSQIKAAQAASARNKAIADYMSKIRGKIKGNIVLPPELKGNPEAVFDVVQLPSGEILSAKLKKSSGHTGYDSAVERAILKSSPLPKPDSGELFHRDLELKFRPLED